MIKNVKTKVFKLKDLCPSQYNPRRIRDENRVGLRASMGRFGCVEDIVVNIRGGRNVIVGGHQRYDILLKENGPQCPWSCKVVDLSEADEKALNLALNNPHLQGEFTEQLPEHIRFPPCRVAVTTGRASAHRENSREYYTGYRRKRKRQLDGHRCGGGGKETTICHPDGKTLPWPNPVGL